jgi:hypothetical protein
MYQVNCSDLVVALATANFDPTKIPDYSGILKVRINDRDYYAIELEGSWGNMDEAVREVRKKIEGRGGTLVAVSYEDKMDVNPKIRVFQPEEGLATALELIVEKWEDLPKYLKIELL